MALNGRPPGQLLGGPSKAGPIEEETYKLLKTPAAGRHRTPLNVQTLVVSVVSAWRVHDFGEDICSAGCSSGWK